MQESQTSLPGTATEATKPEAQTPASDAGAESGLKSLAELLAKGEPSGDGESSGDDEGKGGAAAGDGQKKSKPKKFNDLAGTLGIELDELYKLEIASTHDGKPITIEQLKDLHAKQETHVLRELEFEEKRQQQESELIRAQSELRELMAALPEKAIKPEVLERIRKKHDDVQAFERGKTLEVIPEWRDEKRRAEDIRGMIDHLKGYGFPENYLQTVFNHRSMKYIRDNWMREQRIRRALDLVKSGKPNPTTTAKATGKAPKKPAAATPKKPGRNRLEQFFSGVE